MKITKYIVTAVSSGETCNGKAIVIGVCNTEEEAKNLVRSDIEDWVDRNAGEGVECDFDRMCAWFDYNVEDRCEWNNSSAEVDC